LDGGVTDSCKPRWDTIGTKKKNPASDRGVLYVLHGRDFDPIAVNVAQPDLFHALAKVSVDIEHPCNRRERSWRRSERLA